MKTWWLVALALQLALGACGHRGPVVRVGDDAKLTTAELRTLRKAQGAASEAALVLPAQAQPRRVDDVESRAKPRAEDPFDLPPK